MYIVTAPRIRLLFVDCYKNFHNTALVADFLSKFKVYEPFW